MDKITFELKLENSFKPIYVVKGDYGTTSGTRLGLHAYQFRIVG